LYDPCITTVTAKASANVAFTQYADETQGRTDRKICNRQEDLEVKVMSTEEVIKSYYESQSRKDDKWKDLWSDDAVFSDASQTLLAKGKEAVIQSFTPFLKGVETLRISQMIVEDEKACSIISYTYINPKGERLNQDVAEVAEVNRGKLAKLTIYFDLTAYRSFMRG
jgi:ketosteroid isomerase-like protein